METLEEYYETLNHPVHVAQLQEIMDWIEKEFPQLEFKIAWKQPMFTHEGTFILAFSASKQHFSVSPESKGIDVFEDKIKQAGYTHGSNLFRIKWTDTINYPLLKEIIQYNLDDKKGCLTFWRKND